MRTIRRNTRQKHWKRPLIATIRTQSNSCSVLKCLIGQPTYVDERTNVRTRETREPDALNIMYVGDVNWRRQSTRSGWVIQSLSYKLLGRIWLATDYHNYVAFGPWVCLPYHVCLRTKNLNQKAKSDRFQTLIVVKYLRFPCPFPLRNSTHTIVPRVPTDF